VSARQLPLFPLPLVLFPGVPLPLHIFEPRYRQMLSDCLEGDRRFGIVFRPEGLGEQELPPGHVGCVAQIEKSELLLDGRSNIVVVGTERFELQRFATSTRLYHVGEVTSYDDAAEPADALDPLATRLRELFARVGRAARALSDDAEKLPPLPDDAGLLSFAVAAAIDLEPPARQRLLVSRSPLGRLRELEGLLAPAVEPIELRAAVHARAKSNGHGPHSES
jgi:Lon protease-like protein